jgi:hypothetical protein
MAKTSAAKQQTIVTRREGGKKRNKGIHSKSRTSHLKTSKYYTKEYKGQGR